MHLSALLKLAASTDCSIRKYQSISVKLTSLDRYSLIESHILYSEILYLIKMFLHNCNKFY